MATVSVLVVTLLTMSVYMHMAADAHGIWLRRDSSRRAAHAAAATAAARAEAVMQLQSNVISQGGEFPKRNTCDEGDVSPQLAWSDPPASVKSFALILDDPDAPSGTFTHWLVWDIPAVARDLPEQAPATPQLPGGGTQGRNDFGKIGYGGPCPPPGKPHRYFVRLYALDATLGLKPGAGRRDLERAMKGHMVGHAELMARYGR